MLALRNRHQLVVRATAPSFFHHHQQYQNASSFTANAIKVTRTKKPLPKPDPSKLVFGKAFSDHMLLAKWTIEKGWSAPEIKPLQNLQLHPAAKVLHYAQEIFEGMKAYRGVDGVIRLFRPEMNAKRLLRSAERAGFPSFNANELVNCIRHLVKEDVDWVPNCHPEDLSRSSTLYIRPYMIGTEPTLGVMASSEVLFGILVGPVGPYFPTGFKPVSLFADPSMVRSWPGGTGFAKMGSNYAPTLALQKLSTENGCQQVLWLFGKNNNITEVGAMNIFMVLKDEVGKMELITPPLTNGLILPGVTRDSILEIARDWPDIAVKERDVTLDELLQLNEEKRVVEMFGAGTACIVCPVNEIVFKGKRHQIVQQEGHLSFARRAVDELTGIQFGKPDLLRKKPHWVDKVC